MRSPKKNKQKLYDSLQSEEIPVYDRDEVGNIKYIEVDGKQEPIPVSTKAGYDEPAFLISS